MSDFPAQQYLKASQVAELLNMTTSNVYKQIDAGTLPSVRIGGSVRVPARALMARLGVEPAVTSPPPPPLERIMGTGEFIEQTGHEPRSFLDMWRLGEIDDDERTVAWVRMALNLTLDRERTPS